MKLYLSQINGSHCGVHEIDSNIELLLEVNNIFDNEESAKLFYSEHLHEVDKLNKTYLYIYDKTYKFLATKSRYIYKALLEKTLETFWIEIQEILKDNKQDMKEVVNMYFTPEIYERLIDIYNRDLENDAEDSYDEMFNAKCSEVYNIYLKYMYIAQDLSTNQSFVKYEKIEGINMIYTLFQQLLIMRVDDGYLEEEMTRIDLLCVYMVAREINKDISCMLNYSQNPEHFYKDKKREINAENYLKNITKHNLDEMYTKAYAKIADSITMLFDDMLIL